MCAASRMLMLWLLPKVDATGQRPMPFASGWTAAPETGPINPQPPPDSTSAATIEPCPAWCLARGARTWSCETTDCQPCLEACLAVEAYDGHTATGGNQSAAERARRVSQQQSWTCSPTWPPQHLYVLFASPRSASTTACSVIHTLDNAYCAAELMNRHLVARDDERSLLTSDPARFLQYKFESAFADKRAAP